MNYARFCFGTVSLFFVCVWNIYSREPLNRFAPNSHGGRVCPSLVRVWRSRSKVKVTRDKRHRFSAPSAACVRFMFGKISLASSFYAVFLFTPFSNDHDISTNKAIVDITLYNRAVPWWVTEYTPYWHRLCLADYGQIWRHSQNRKYITYCSVIRGGRSHSLR